jgi:hypothetical protein
MFKDIFWRRGQSPGLTDHHRDILKVYALRGGDRDAFLDEQGMCGGKLALVGAGRTHRQIDAADADPDEGADLEELEAMRKSSLRRFEYDRGRRGVPSGSGKTRMRRATPAASNATVMGAHGPLAETES